jgi:IclR family transcriptional regulator, acetate operon repressor
MARRAEKPDGSRYMVPVVMSTFTILAELSKAGPLSLNEIAQCTGVSKSTVFRILTTLHHLGYIVRSGPRHYQISRNLASLVSDDANTDVLRQLALAHMLRLRDESGETVNLGHLQLDKVVYIEVVPSEFALRISERPGATVSVHASALGKAILAFSPPELAESLIRFRDLPVLTARTIVDPDKLLDELKRVRERGFAFDRGETSSLATCIAAPILGTNGMSIAAMSISGPSSRFNPRLDSPVVVSLLKSASEISRQLRHRPLVLNSHRGRAGKAKAPKARSRR